MKKIFIGTSGWSYQHWKGLFYPVDIKESEELSYYQRKFQTVEINSSFYHIPKSETFLRWKKQTNKNFIFSLKASRYITHIKKLKTDNEAVEHFLVPATLLKEKMGPILFQLPPGWKLNLDRLENFLKHLPKKFRYTFEFRNPTWFDERVYELLRKYHCALCIYHVDQFLSPMIATSDFIYVRFHGPKYNRSFLKKWAQKIESWKKMGLDVYVYFNNDLSAYAVSNALTLIELTA